MTGKGETTNDESSRTGGTDGDSQRIAPNLLPGTEGRPLSDVTVLELGHIVAGPFCSMVLADLGAEVIKVEHPERGDAVRNSSPVGNASFDYVNRNKIGVSIDLKSEEGRAVFEDLVAEADVLIENFAAGTVDRLGVGYDDLSALNDELVYCSIKGFNEGPYQEYPALDPVAEALSGVMSVTGRPGHPPVRCGTSLADMAASLYGAVSVLAGVRQRDADGEGQHITVPLYGSTVSLMGYWLAYTQSSGHVAEPIGAGHPNWAPYDVFQTADDAWVFVGPSSQQQWEALCTALEVDLHRTERYATLDDRRANRERLTEELQTVCERFDAGDLIDRLRDVGVPVAPVNDTKDVVEDRHLRETDALGTIRATEGGGGDIDVPRYPARSNAFRRVENADPPELGEDTDAVLEALGYGEEERERLRQRGAV
ncbi:CoA transferase [Halorubrum sp. 48-1-W]|uniref:CaiB/BaiF CoA transferase family protein n=1 Tax=Halorubrum sp. 48-1-W TaxID=2249761 RepID=UPI000DCCD897|nr:CaiB/BaiF CoA-transferase family protein [Halorubrum sp. 48-1-W]RAW45923.1 CoA transferase [Halorubrum sp. 48-1-W]